MKKKLAAWSVHYFTATGTLCALYAMFAINADHPRAALIWLMVAFVIDGLDGQLARKFNVKKHAAIIDGNVLDLVIDYMTCVIVPVLFAIHFDIFPKHLAGFICSLIVFVSALWFSRKDIETRDYWFRGFPTAWNLVIPALWLLNTSIAINAAVAALFIVLTITPKAKFFHVLRAPQFQPYTIILSAILVGLMSFMILNPREEHLFVGKLFIIVWTIYATAVSIWRSLQPDEII
jgi:phosphatidylcholine synthase